MNYNELVYKYFLCQHSKKRLNQENDRTKTESKQMVKFFNLLLQIVPRYGATLTAVNNYITLYLFGGELMKNTPTPEYTNDLVVFNTERKSTRLIKLENSKAAPEERHFHSAVVHSSSIFVFGGRGKTLFRDVWEFSCATETWKSHTPTGGPSARFGHSAVAFQNQMFVFGGQNTEGKVCNDLFAFSFTDFTWKQIPLTNAPSLYHHTAILLPNTSRMLIFGGLDENQKATNTTVMIDVNSGKVITPALKRLPKPRYGHTCFTIGDVNFIIGGSTSNQDFLDVHQITIKYATKAEPKVKFDCMTNFPLSSSKFTFARICTIKDTVYFTSGISKAYEATPTQTQTVEQQQLLNNLNKIDDSVLLRILSYFTRNELCVIACTSKIWKFATLSAHNDFWKAVYEKVTHNFQTFVQANSIKLSTMIQQPGGYKQAVIFAHRKKRDIVLIYEKKCDAIVNTACIDSKNRYVGYDALKAAAIKNPGSDDKIKTVTVGSTTAGKTCLNMVISGQPFPTDSIPQTYAANVLNITVGDSQHNIDLWE